MIESYIERWDLGKEGYRVSILRDGTTLEWCETTSDGCTTGRGATLKDATMPRDVLGLIATFIGEGYELGAHEDYDPGQLLAYLKDLEAPDIAETTARCDAWKGRAQALQAEADQLRRQLDAAEAAPCRHEDGSAGRLRIAQESIDLIRNTVGVWYDNAAGEGCAIPHPAAWYRARIADFEQLLALVAPAEPTPLESAVTEALADIATLDTVVVRHAQPGIEGDAPEHPGLFADCPYPPCATSRRQHAAADRIQDITAELFADPAPPAPPWLIEAGDD